MPLVGFIGWCYRMDYMVRSTREDVNAIIRHTEWGETVQGPGDKAGAPALPRTK